jgi:hypothetical protein
MSTTQSIRPYFQTEDTTLAACLSNCGVRLQEDFRHAIANIYSLDYPCGNGRPGRVVYTFEAKSIYGQDARELAAAYERMDAAERLDELLSQLPAEIRGPIEDALYAAMMVYSHQAIDNRDVLAKAWLGRNIKPLAEVRKGKRYAIVQRDGRSEKTNRYLNSLIG